MTVTSTPDDVATPTRVRPRRRPLRQSGLPYLLALPVAAVVVVIAGWPLVKIVLLSLQQQQSGKYALFHDGGTTPFVGFANFGNVLSDSTFWTVVLRTVVFTAVNVGLSVAIGIGVALLLNRVSRWARLLLVVVLLFVWAIPTTVSTQVFYWLFSNQYGVADYLLNKLPGVSMQGHDWFADPHQGLAVVTLVVVWGAVPLLAISLHAGLTQIPQEVLEAGRLDGANGVQLFRHVILPYLAPLLAVLTTLSVIWDFGVFNQIWFMRNGHPEPGYQVLGTYMYSEGVGQSHYNLGATVAILMMIGLLAVVVVYIRQLVRIGDAA